MTQMFQALAQEKGLNSPFVQSEEAPAKEIPAPTESYGLDSLDLQGILDFIQSSRQWVEDELLTVGSLMELGAILLAFGLAWVTNGWVNRIAIAFHRRFLKGMSEEKLTENLLPILFALVWLFWAAMGRLVLSSLGYQVPLTGVAMNLMGAWVLIRTFTNVFKDPFWEQTVAVFAWSIAALNIFGLLKPLVAFLDRIGFSIGEVHLTVLLVIKAIALVIVLLWAASLLSSFLQRRIQSVPSITPSVQILVTKILRIVLVALAFFISLTSLGIDLSIFAVLGGAIGIGVGFGLQKIVGNFISGLILLMDRSIKPGDVIEVGGTYGWVRSLGARYTSVVTRDGHEHLIPNEDFIVNTVTNWSFSDKNVRIRAPIGVSYNADIYKARELIVDAALAVDRVLRHPGPLCHLVGFGDNSVDLELRFWLSDPESGTANVRSEVLLGVWDRFKEHGIEIPFPQRDIHIKEMPKG